MSLKAAPSFRQWEAHPKHINLAQRSSAVRLEENVHRKPIAHHLEEDMAHLIGLPLDINKKSTTSGPGIPPNTEKK